MHRGEDHECGDEHPGGLEPTRPQRHGEELKRVQGVADQAAVWRG